MPTGIRQPRHLEEIKVIGKQTGEVKTATIASIALTLPAVPWPHVIFQKQGNAWFESLIQLSGVVSQPGDSGAAFVATSDMKLVGLTMGASKEYSFGCAIPDPLPF